MHLLATGLNHKSAPLELRERLSFTSSTLCAFLEQLGQVQSEAVQPPKSSDSLYESIVVSTCNRLEYYTLTPNPELARQEITNLLSQTFQISPAAFQSHLYHWQDEAAVTHLMRVATGLDSMVLGEAQILGQLVTAHQSAAAHHTAGPILSRLFEMAIHAGKRVRTETDIGLNPASVSSVAVRLAQRHLGDLSSKVVVVLGAGEMGALTVKALLKQGIKKLLIVNRTKERVNQLANQWNTTALSFDQLVEAMRQADLVISSTGAPHTVLHYSQVVRAIEDRSERPLLIVDIAIPRDVEAEIEKLPNVHLYNLDHLQTQVADNLEARRQEIPKVEAILAQETTTFTNWYRSLDIVPTIVSFRKQFEAIRQQELKRTLNRLEGLSEREQQLVSELSQRLLNKFLHQPTVHLRAEAAHGNGIMYAHALHKLFALEIESL
jgi:glutamyl-tRNA reductase